MLNRTKIGVLMAMMVLLAGCNAGNWYMIHVTPGPGVATKPATEDSPAMVGGVNIHIGPAVDGGLMDGVDPLPSSEETSETDE